MVGKKKINLCWCGATAIVIVPRVSVNLSGADIGENEREAAAQKNATSGEYEDAREEAAVACTLSRSESRRTGRGPGMRQEQRKA
jgi:hypothetical protein